MVSANENGLYDNYVDKIRRSHMLNPVTLTGPGPELPHHQPNPNLNLGHNRPTTSAKGLHAVESVILSVSYMHTVHTVHTFMHTYIHTYIHIDITYRHLSIHSVNCIHLLVMKWIKLESSSADLTEPVLPLDRYHDGRRKIHTYIHTYIQYILCYLCTVPAIQCGRPPQRWCVISTRSTCRSRSSSFCSRTGETYATLVSRGTIGLAAKMTPINSYHVHSCIYIKLHIYLKYMHISWPFCCGPFSG